MNVQELISKLARLNPKLDVYVACNPGHDHCLLEYVLPKECTDDDYLLLAGEFDNVDA